MTQVQQTAKTNLNQQTAKTRSEAFKWVKARVVTEDNDLVMDLIQVPLSDPRPAVDPKNPGSMVSPTEAQPGNPMGKA